jgi:hypothetical protein
LFGGFFALGGGAPPESGHVEKAVPVWGLPTVVARPDDGFTIIH